MEDSSRPSESCLTRFPHYIGILKAIFMKNNICFVSKLMVIFFRLAETEELTQSDTGRSQNLVLTVTEDETTLPSQNAGK